MEDIKVSVIVPVYNAQNYLEKSLESICSQRLEEIEIICVDDGSTDNSKNIIKSFIEKDGRIRLIEQKNLFAGIARNNGFKQAKGEYTVFWDADDFFDESALETMYEKSVSVNADVCICDAYNYRTETDESYISKDFVRYSAFPKVDPFSKNDIPDKIFNLGANVPWNKMFRSQFIRDKGLLFQDLKQANDTYFVLMALYFADRITYTKKRLIHYRCDSEGNITSTLPAIPPGAFSAYSYLKNELEKLPDFSEENKRSFINRAARGMLRVLHTQTTQEGFDAVKGFLVNEGFEKLGLLCDAEVYYNSWIYDDIQSIISNTSTEHMIYKFNSAKLAKEKLTSKNAELGRELKNAQSELEKERKSKAKLEQKLSEKNEKVTELKEKLRVTKDSLKESKANNAGLKDKLKESKADNARLKDSLKDKNEELAKLKGKWYVRLFSKLERLFKRK